MATLTSHPCFDIALQLYTLVGPFQLPIKCLEAKGNNAISFHGPLTSGGPAANTATNTALITNHVLQVEEGLGDSLRRGFLRHRPQIDQQSHISHGRSSTSKNLLGARVTE